MTTPLTDAEIAEARALELPRLVVIHDEATTSYCISDGNIYLARACYIFAGDTAARREACDAVTKIAAACNAHHRLLATIAARDAENRELRAEVSNLRSRVNNQAKWIRSHDAHINAAAVLEEHARLRAEVERLTKERDEARDSDAESMAMYRRCRDRLDAALEVRHDSEPPRDIFIAPVGPSVRCEVCCAPIEPGEQVASWVDEDSWAGSGRQVVAHAGTCPPDLWLLQCWLHEGEDEWTKARTDTALPYEEACAAARDAAGQAHVSSVRLIRQRAKEPRRG